MTIGSKDSTPSEDRPQEARTDVSSNTPVTSAPAVLATEAPRLPLPSKPPPVFETYRDWAKTYLGEPFDDKARRVYETNATTAQLTAQRHDFFTSLRDFLKEIDKEYRAKTQTNLFSTNDGLELVTKSFQSMIDKSYRFNILRNRKYPNPPKNPQSSSPKGEWVTSGNWIKRFNDVVRGTLICKYLDGPEFVARRLKARADSMGLASRFYSQQLDDGYYAYHFYVGIPVEIIDVEWSSAAEIVEVEIQLTTQLQDALRALTHRFYETLRLQVDSDSEEWKWDFSTSRFKASYLSHTLHLIEGLIVELRRATHEKVPSSGSPPEQLQATLLAPVTDAGNSSAQGSEPTTPAQNESNPQAPAAEAKPNE